MPHITFVKKILANGEMCKKCHEVSQRMAADGLLKEIDHIVIADERDADSNGMRLAREHQVERAPFFLIQDEHGQVEVFDIYFKFRKQMVDNGFMLANTVGL